MAEVSPADRVGGGYPVNEKDKPGQRRCLEKVIVCNQAI